MAEQDTPWGKIGAVAGVIAAVVTLAFVFWPELDPKSPHAGEIVEIRDVEYFPDSVTSTSECT